MTRIALALASLMLLGCPPMPDPVVPVSGATCADVCTRAAELGCPSAQPTPNGASCEDVCKSVQAGGIMEWDLGCRAAARSCEDADVCEG